ncbi:MAG: inorganic phosphate transporter [Candidatus Bipolaricaulia bacterium]
MGANDAANIFGPAVGTRAVRFWTAALITSAFVIVGALAQGIPGIETYKALSDQTATQAVIITLAAALTVTGMTYLGMPVSTTQAMVGSIIGIGLIQGNVNWGVLARVVLAWILTPVGGAIAAYLFYRLAAALVEEWLTSLQTYDRIIRIGFIVVGAYGAFSLGANNVANVTGVYVGADLLTPHEGVLLGSVSIALGVLTYSRRVMDTVGRDLVPLEPFSALIAIMGESLTLYIYAIIGIPVSASQAIVGAVLGIGLVKGVRTIDRRTVRNILFAWVGTPMTSAALALLLHHIWRWWFG